MTSPLFSSAIAGYRLWKIQRLPSDQISLSPLVFSNLPWQPGVNESVCPAHGKVPDRNCDCGFNAYHSYELARKHGTNMVRGYMEELELIMGAIAGRGTTRVHSQGFRCQQAQILGFLHPPRSSWNRTDLADCQRLAEHFQVPLFHSIKPFKAHVNALAASVPKSYRPGGQHQATRKSPF